MSRRNFIIQRVLHAPGFETDLRTNSNALTPKSNTFSNTPKSNTLKSTAPKSTTVIVRHRRRMQIQVPIQRPIQRPIAVQPLQTIKPIQPAKISVVTIGINYFGQESELKGCVNDSNNFLNFVQGTFGGNIASSVQLIDSLSALNTLYPTLANIQTALRDQIQICVEKNITHLWVHYSGHGSQERDRSSDESDGLDETLVPVDYDTAGLIADDWLLSEFINKIPSTVNVFCIIDACHSESVLDLTYKFEPTTSLTFKQILVNPKCNPMANVMLISGCKDNSVSYDAWDAEYGASGALSASFLKLMKANRKMAASLVLQKMRADVKKNGYPQIPQLSCTKHVSLIEPIYGIGVL